MKDEARILFWLCLGFSIVLILCMYGCGGSDEPIQNMTIGKPDCSNPKNCV